MITRFRHLSATGAFQGALMSAAMVIAGGFDALVNIIAGRWLIKEQFAIFVAVTALLQIAVQLTNVIRNVTAYYTAELTTSVESMSAIRSFLRKNWRWAWRWGIVATAVALLLSPLIAQFMKIEPPWPVFAGSLALLMLFVRPVTDGTLQGIQNFIGLSSVQVLQSVLRLFFAVVLILIGWQAFGAMLSLPLATTSAMLVAVWFLQPYFREPQATVAVPTISLRYSTFTLIGLLAYALLVNLDAIVVKRYFSEAIAGDYSTVVTLGKINLFATLGIALVLFPKATQRQSAGKDPRPVLALALLATFAVGALLTTAYFLFSGLLVQTIFTDSYADPGIILGLVGAATTLYAGVNIWLNYALSLNRHTYIIALAILVTLVIVAMGLFHESLLVIVAIMLAAGVSGNVAGAFLTLPTERDSPRQGPQT